MKIALVQLNSVNDIRKNLSEIEVLIRKCGEAPERERPKIIFFPENSLFFRIDEGEKIQAISLNDDVFNKLSRLSLDTGIQLHITTALFDAEKVWNASVLIVPNQPPKIMYKKIHLFDIALVGQRPIRESDVFSEGVQPSVFEIDGIKFGSSICYDLRFSELYRVYARQEVDVILIPAAFLVKTGIAHWDVLLRARAIESQCYVLAPAQSGVHRSVSSDQTRSTFGHTMAVGPWGDVLCQKPSETGILMLDISPDVCRQVRQQIPMKNHRRL
jgi:predicted amidohydrolase